MRVSGLVLAVVVCLWPAGPLWPADGGGARTDESKPQTGKTQDDIDYVDAESGEQENPPGPFGGPEEAPPDARSGRIELSDGKSLEGKIYLTRDSKLRFYHRRQEKLLLLDLAQIDWLEQRVVQERMEPEWRWKENASDEKVYTGKTYPMREYETVLHLADGKELVGDCTALVHLRHANGQTRCVLHKRDKGKVGQKLDDLVYVKTIDFRAPAAGEKGEHKDGKPD